MPRRIHTSHDFQGDVYKFLHVFIPAATTQHKSHLRCFSQAEHSCGEGLFLPTKGCPEENETLGAGGEVYTWQILAHGKGWKLDLDPTHPPWLLTSVAPCSTRGVP